jgi:hypothetical protein
MVLPIVVFLLGLQGNGQLSGELNRLQGEVQRLRADLDETQRLLREELKPECSAESRVHTGELKIVDTITPIRANLFSMVSSPADSCLPAEVRVTASYFDPMGSFVCSGTLELSQTTPIQNTVVEFRPCELETFLKWWEGATLREQLLVCRDHQGNESRSPTDSATFLRIFVTVFPRRGGLSTSEIQLDLPRLQRR